MACALLCCVCAQGPKPKPCDTGGKKRWNKGAPLSKKNKGIGRGKKPSKLGVTVPLPKAIEDIERAEGHASMAPVFEAEAGAQ